MTAAVAVAAVTGLSATPAVADGVVVSPGTPRPGQRIHISVSGCSAGPTPHVARSQAFRHAVTLYGKADTGEADPRLKKGLPTGTYPITASCGDHAVHGRVVVIAGGGPSGGTASVRPGGPPAVHVESPTARTTTATIDAHPAASHGGGRSGTAYWLIGAALVVLAGGTGIFLLRRRRTP